MRFHKVALKQLHQNKIEKHPEKTYAVEFSLNTNASGSLPGKSSQWSHLIKLIGLPLETEPL